MGHCFSSNENDEVEESSDQKHELGGGNVQLITTMQSWELKMEEAKRDQKIVIANFSATWCGPCKAMTPFYVQLSNKHHSSFVFLTVDVDELTEFSTKWDIKATPTFFFLRDGQQIDKLVGANKPELQKKIAAILASEGASSSSQT